MKFPGDNELTLCKEAVRELLATQLSATFGSAVRVTSFTLSTYGSDLEVKFTSDAEAPLSQLEQGPPPRVYRVETISGSMRMLYEEPF